MIKDVDKVIRAMSQVCGKDIAMFEVSFLAKVIEKRRNALDIKTISSYCGYLEKSAVEAEAFFDSLNITYSEFFRNPLTFALLEQWILPRLVEQKSGEEEIRVWSAGCSAGQEAYSMAMLLDKLGSVAGSEVHFRVFGTDISTSALALAREGEYDQESVRNVKLGQLQRYFIKNGDKYNVVPHLREHISFSVFDLLDPVSANPPESIYGDFDIVFCSNLLFYYAPAIRDFILQKVCQSISARGYLITGEAERAMLERMDGMKMMAPPAAIFQRKRR